MTTYLQLGGLFATLSLLSIGGGNAVLPEMHLKSVKGEHWLTDTQFAEIFSISQAAPGPSILIVALVGYGAGLSVGGVPGAILGGLMLGLIDSVVATALGAEPAFLLSFVFIILLLLFRPAGLFGHAPA